MTEEKPAMPLSIWNVPLEFAKAGNRRPQDTDDLSIAVVTKLPLLRPRTKIKINKKVVIKNVVEILMT